MGSFLFTKYIHDSKISCKSIKNQQNYLGMKFELKSSQKIFSWKSKQMENCQTHEMNQQNN